MCTIVLCAPVTSAGAVTLVTLRLVLPTAPDRLGAGFHLPGGGRLPALAWPGTTFPYLWAAV